MTSRDFAYWLMGYFEITGINNPTPLTADQVGMIRRHLNMVFVHEIDPSFPQEQQVALNEAHTDVMDATQYPHQLDGGGIMRC